MPSTQSCTPCCSTPQSVDIPGPIGADGFNGINGNDGVNAYTVTLSALPPPNPPTPYILPAPNTDISVNVANTSWMVVGQVVMIAGPANFKVISITSPTAVVLRFLENPGDLPQGSTIAVGAGVSPSAIGISAFTFTTANFTIPAIGDPTPVTVYVVNSEWVTAGASVFINGDYFTVASDPTSTTSMSLFYSNVTSNVNAGNPVVSGAKIISGNHSGENAYTLIIAPTVVTPTPVGSNVTVNVANSGWMVPGEAVVVGGSWGKATFSVSGTPPTPTTAVLKFLGYPNDVASGITMTAGSRVAACGLLYTNETHVGYASGAAYPLTTTPALLAIVTTQPTITLGGAGTYLIMANVQYAYRNYNGSNVNTPLVTTLLHSSTLGPIANSSTTWTGDYRDTSGQPNLTAHYVPLPAVIYVATAASDVIEVWGSYSGLIAIGDIAAVEANIVAVKLAPTP